VEPAITVAKKMEKETKTVAETTVHQLGELSGKSVKVHNPSNFTQGVTDNEATTTNTTQGNDNSVV
jgi:hypothetical protein